MRLPELGPVSRFTPAATHATADRYGVRKPILRDTDISTTNAQNRRMEETPEHFAVSISKMAATEILSSSNATPGLPCGNIENSLCMSVSVAAYHKIGHPK